jgi:hypothetical protein
VTDLRERANNVADPVHASCSNDRVDLVLQLGKLRVVEEVGRRRLDALDGVCESAGAQHQLVM